MKAHSIMVENGIKYHIGSHTLNGILYRKCRKCREIKVLNNDNFVKRNTENGWRGECRICFNEHQRFKQEMSKHELVVSKKYRDKYRKEKPLECLLRHARGNAKRRFKEFDLDLDTIYDLWNNQSGFCFYTGRRMRFEIGFPDSVSLDRIDSSRGYLNDNIALCQKQVNIMKNDATIEELITFCKDVLNKFEVK